ncbi:MULTISPECIES: RNA-binding S4 domain-containing protein [Myroides]|uniref:RNA-binding S4 domain-containing protein n=1 Tax=Myroides albus TaxID=2562892 RepID=A0A6I3LPF1_9FLAO|nr:MULTISPECIES: RNA-binding S4 domain-containing protein [Myroides]MTG98012.1 RNA-binding S4 domain-containing protein [Myroides albus]MVX36386.1 RNA-binding S4 domain-containing protein [Myroides sp. LoEW2-1]UVD80304.1 RNA-binding S4 domain-containing protein [Myroides albus]
MRIDKYLWCVRYYKTRNIATEACKKGHVTVNGQAAKPSREVFPTDKITLRKDQIVYQLSVLDIPQNRVGAKLVDIYRRDTTPEEAFEHIEMLRLAKSHYRANGTGRPTKKDLRDINDFLDYEDDEDEVNE